MAAQDPRCRAAWLPRLAWPGLLWAGLLPNGTPLAAAPSATAHATAPAPAPGVGTGTGGASAPGVPADARADHRRQQARCQTLPVAAVRAECLRQADRDLAWRLRSAAPAVTAASAAPSPPASAAGHR